MKILFKAVLIAVMSLGIVAVTAQQITGAQEFTVMEPPESEVYVSVADFGAHPSKSGKVNQKAIMGAIERARILRIPKVIIPKGTYYIDNDATYQLTLMDIENLTIDGQGSELIIPESETGKKGAYILISRCKRIKVCNLSLDWDWNRFGLFGLATVVSVDKTNLKVLFSFSGCNVPPTDEINPGVCRAWDPSINNRDANVGFAFPLSSVVHSYEKTGDKTMIATYKNASDVNKLSVGQMAQVVFTPKRNASGIRIEYSSHITFDNVNIWSAPYESFVSMSCDNLQIINSQVRPKPGTDRLFSTYGCMEIHEHYRNFRLENCVIEGTGDDQLHLSNHFLGGGLTRVDENTVYCENLQTWTSINLTAPGHHLELYSDQFEPLGWSSEILESSSEYNSSTGVTRAKIKFADPLPSSLTASSMFWNQELMDGNFIIRNNTFSKGLCHALYIGMSNGTIEGNTITNMAYPSLILNTVVRWSKWYLGTPVKNIIIRDNILKDCNTDRRDPSSMFVGAGYDYNPSDYYPVNYHSTRDVLVEGNIVENSTWSAFSIFSAKNVHVIGNRFINSNIDPSKTRFAGKGNMFVLNSSDITIENNVFYNAGESYESGLYVDPATTSNVIINGNVGDKPTSHYNPYELVVSGSSDALNIYVKGSKEASNKYIRHRLYNAKNTAKNLNVWRIVNSYLTERTSVYNFSNILSKEFIYSGEWECAIRQTVNGVPKSDFMGGFHGYEELVDVNAWADGKKISLGTTINLTAYNVTVDQNSILYEYGTKNPVAEHLKHYVFSKDKIHLYQEVKWLKSINVVNSYLAMLPIARSLPDGTAITDRGTMEHNPTVFNIGVPNASLPFKGTNIRSARVWGEESGISASLTTVFFPLLPKNSFMCSMYTAQDGYNKLYFDFSGSYTTTVDEVWESTAIYEIDINN
ncbi:MAG: right-handed parallel beta-helix repeat-containing protein [Paludibacter sp.]|nr:right-handed parallel beta-helix repeat-containing protein [Paludibacter sp.]